MAQVASPTLIPIAQTPARVGLRILSPEAIANVAPITERTVVYSPMITALVPARGYFRSHVGTIMEFYTAAPDNAQYDKYVIWLGNTKARWAPSLGSSVAEQRNRTFGGASPPYYKALRAPNPNDIARLVGGVING